MWRFPKWKSRLASYFRRMERLCLDEARHGTEDSRRALKEVAGYYRKAAETEEHKRAEAAFKGRSQRDQRVPCMG